MEPSHAFSASQLTRQSSGQSQTTAFNMNVNLITYNAAITALAKCDRKCSKDYAKVGITMLEREVRWPKIQDLIDQMKQDGIEPDGFCCSSAINCCGAERWWQEACDIIES